MRTVIDTSVAVVLQHTLSGLGRFNGAEVGRPQRVIGATTARVTIKAKSFGTDDHAFHTQFFDSGGTVPSTKIQWVDPTHMRVHLRRTSSAITATAQEVADAINADGKLYADAGGTDVVAAAGDAALSGGVNATQTLTHYRLAPATGVHGGLFFFDGNDPIEIMQVSGRFDLSGPLAVKVETVTLGPGLAPIEAEAVTIFTSTPDVATPSFITNDSRILSARQAIRVSMAASGVVQVVAQHAERPYLGG